MVLVAWVFLVKNCDLHFGIELAIALVMSIAFKIHGVPFIFKSIF